MNRTRIVGLAAAPTLLFSTATALAQETPPAVAADAGQASTDAKTEAATGPEEGEREPGWSPGIAIGAGFNLIDSRSVVGQQEGTTVTISGGLDAALEFNKGMHEWRNGLLASAGVARTPTIDEYLKFATALILAFGLIFEMPVVLVFLSLLGVVTPEGLAKYRRHAVVVMAVISAFLTPADPYTMLAMMVPMLLLYEASIGMSKLLRRRRESPAELPSGEGSAA